MHVISKARLVDFWIIHPDAKVPLRTWYSVMKACKWGCLAELRKTFPSADLVVLGEGKTAMVFNIGGNKFRLIAAVRYRIGRIFVLAVMTHAEYSKNRWKNTL